MNLSVSRNNQSEPPSNYAERLNPAHPQPIVYRDIPKDRITDTIVRTAIDFRHQRVLAYTPYHLLSHELCLYAVSKDGQHLQDIPDTLRTQAICEKAVAQNPDVLVQLTTAQRAEMHAQTDEKLLVTFLQEATDEAVHLRIIQAHPYLLPYVPDFFRNAQLCEIALTGSPTSDVCDAIPEKVQQQIGLVRRPRWVGAPTDAPNRYYRVRDGIDI